jgi:hypothetical protein
MSDEAPATTASQHDWLIEYLRDRDVGCPLCDYNLRGLVSDRCPECGREIRLNVQAAEPYLRAWVIAAMALGGSAGIGIFILVIVVKEGWPPVRMVGVCFAMVYFLIAIPLFGILIFARRAFLRREKSTQELMAGASIVTTLLALLLLLLEMAR